MLGGGLPRPRSLPRHTRRHGVDACRRRPPGRRQVSGRPHGGSCRCGRALHGRRRRADRRRPPPRAVHGIVGLRTGDLPSGRGHGAAGWNRVARPREQPAGHRSPAAPRHLRQPRCRPRQLHRQGTPERLQRGLHGRLPAVVLCPSGGRHHPSLPPRGRSQNLRGRLPAQLLGRGGCASSPGHHCVRSPRGLLALPVRANRWRATSPMPHSSSTPSWGTSAPSRHPSRSPAPSPRREADRGPITATPGCPWLGRPPQPVQDCETTPGRGRRPSRPW